MQCLLLDIGNTNIHFCLSEQKAVSLDSLQIQTTTIEGLASLINRLVKQENPIMQILVSNVSNAKCDETLVRLSKLHDLPLKNITSKANGFRLTNSYKKVSNMGVDRWLAMAAATIDTDKDFMVIDLGTAITTEFVVNDQHLGGWISPGYQTLRSGLLKNTTKVFADNTKKTYENWFGNDTPDCVELGLRSQIQGSFELAVQEMSKQSANYKIFVTGGDRDLINTKNFKHAKKYENMVLSGLSLYID